MNKKIKNTLKFLLFIGIGIVLFWLVYKDQDFAALFHKMKAIKWVWFIPAMLVALLSHIFRAMRWNQLLESMGNYKPRLLNTFFAVLSMYFVNLAIPRLGEITRSGIVSKYDKLPFSKVLGTMVTERGTDFLMLVILTAIALIARGSEMTGFISDNPEFKENVSFLFSPGFWILFVLASVVILISLYYIAKGRLDKYKIFKKTGDFIRNFFSGIKTITRLKHTWRYVLLSVLIFVAYYFMLYLCLPAFDDIPSMQMLSILVVFVAGSFGMVAPSPNGMGAWHFMTIQTMMIFGVLEGDAKLFALVVHSIQTIMLIVLGLISVVGLPIINRKQL
ncbi:MAG: lysylphosphatidylglycerol synthase transmembrane domain-containing protein [Bacteroidota bacterium]|nr:lysylphosphatidylglycerol synthase transmembrane domain-containing protein [Bacteroidota bacterium]